ncbi:hypothetical protein KI387_026825 [Taxus chinensis]|uniref:AP2/ERF domain-containing protein n=1 Tax=Taxus chinensis TaxID=29808 RepID=A0AA38FY07_TAXCH|nr:hypothetical protein KI387_026825 [Taxus chinensis]
MNLQRFLPSEFGNDVDRVHAKSLWGHKVKVRRAIEAESMGQTGLTAPPRDKISILGHGNAKVVFVEEDIGTFTIKAVDDPRTLNKSLYLRIPVNTFSFNELVTLWEKKIGKTMEKVYVPEEALLKTIEVASMEKLQRCEESISLVKCKSDAPRKNGGEDLLSLSPKKIQRRPWGRYAAEIRDPKSKERR